MRLRDSSKSGQIHHLISTGFLCQRYGVEGVGVVGGRLG